VKHELENFASRLITQELTKLSYLLTTTVKELFQVFQSTSRSSSLLLTVHVPMSLLFTVGSLSTHSTLALMAALLSCDSLYNRRTDHRKRNRCLAINNSSLFFARMNHVAVAWQRAGWNIHISSDISPLWSECHSRYVRTRTYSNATLCQNFKAIGEELSEI
jgi:hypothetical protein